VLAVHGDAAQPRRRRSTRRRLDAVGDPVQLHLGGHRGEGARRYPGHGSVSLAHGVRGRGRHVTPLGERVGARIGERRRRDGGDDRGDGDQSSGGTDCQQAVSTQHSSPVDGTWVCRWIRSHGGDRW
jgi:hypothetical protein